MDGTEQIKMDNENISKQLHLARGLHWHEWKRNENAAFSCTCGGLNPRMEEDGETFNPDYCSESSSRSLIGEVERWMFASDPTCEKAQRYIVALCNEVGIDTARWTNARESWQRVLISPEDAYCLATATAEQRARAALSALENSNK